MIDLNGWPPPIFAMKAYENKMKDFHKTVKTAEKNKVLRYCIVLLFGLFHAYNLDLSNFKMA